MLKPEIPPLGATIEAEKAKPKTAGNVYELLEMEESVEEDLLPLSTLPISGERSNQAQQNIEQKKTTPVRVNWVFEAFCAFRDFRAIRRHIKGVWEGYRDGTVDLVALHINTIEIKLKICEKT